jgi:hypothetical protein
METIKSLSDLDPPDLHVIERLFGRPLDACTGAILILRDGELPAGNGNKSPARDDKLTPGDTLPDWCDMYAGLSDAEIEDLESAVLQRANLTRSID